MNVMDYNVRSWQWDMALVKLFRKHGLVNQIKLSDGYWANKGLKIKLRINW